MADEDRERMARQLESIGRIEKCRGCSCYVDTLREYRELLRREGVLEDDPLARRADDLLRGHPEKHGCLGCDPCYPVAVSNRISERTSARADRGLELVVVETRHPEHTILEPQGWPPVPGEYVVGNIRAPVAVSTLASPDLVSALVDALGLRQIAIVGKTETENLGVEKVVRNIVANPSIRVLILCGRDAEGHRPGATLLALSRAGMDAQGRVLGSPGRRPVLKNATPEEVARFREQVEIIDLICESDPEAIELRVEEEASKSRAALGPWAGGVSAAAEEVISIPAWIPDPQGYFVVLAGSPEARIVLECYAYDGRLLGLLRGTSAKPLYHEAIRRGWLSRLDHAAYLGRELTRAEQALEEGSVYVQDAA